MLKFVCKTQAVILVVYNITNIKKGMGPRPE